MSTVVWSCAKGTARERPRKVNRSQTGKAKNAQRRREAGQATGQRGCGQDAQRTGAREKIAKAQVKAKGWRGGRRFVTTFCAIGKESNSIVPGEMCGIHRNGRSRFGGHLSGARQSSARRSFVSKVARRFVCFFGCRLRHFIVFFFFFVAMQNQILTLKR